MTKNKTAYMYGFNRLSTDVLGYLRVLDRGYEIVGGLKYATPFETENVSGKKGWGSPDQWCEFFNGEDELKDWKFHVVRFSGKGEAE